MKRKQGFTLIEIMIVVLIIGMLAAIAIPSFVKARENSRKNACINNLRQIDSAKEQIAMDTGVDTEPSNADIAEYIKGGVFPTCPANGNYTVGAVGTDPTCDVDGHVLPTFEEAEE